MSFRDQVFTDVKGVFLNLDEFGTPHDIYYDGQLYKDVKVVVSGLKENDRKRLMATTRHARSGQYLTDVIEGLYSENIVVHLAQSDLGGHQPEKDARFRITDENGFLKDYYVMNSVSDMGMLRVELEAMTE